MRKLFALLALVAVVFTACDKGEETSTTKSSIVPETTVVEFARIGGEQIVEFSIKHPQGGNITAEENCKWLDAAVEYNTELRITASANTGDAREAKVTLKYAFAKDVVITVKQKAGNTGAYDVEFVANRFEGIYFGTEYSSTPNYYVILSDIGANSDGSPKANGTYYFFDLYNSTAADQESPILPNGEYRYDTENSYANLTFTEEGSWYAVMDENGKFAKSGDFANATVKVEDGKFEAIIEFTNGEKHMVTFEGRLQTTIGHIRSTFTEDVEFAVNGAIITASLYGDSYEVGQQNWFIEAKKGDDLFMVEVFNASTEKCDGIYQVLEAESSDYANRYIPGLVGPEGLVGTWYAKLTNGTIKGDVMAPMAGGILRLTTEGEALTIEYSCVDDAGNNITGSVSGKFIFKDLRE